MLIAFSTGLLSHGRRVGAAIAAGMLWTGSLWGMSLQEALDAAMRHATALQRSRNEVELSRLNREGASVQRFGELNLVGDIVHYNTPRTLGPLTPTIMQSGMPIPEAKNLYSIGLLYTVPLFTGFAQMRQIEISALAQSMAEAKMRLSREEIAYNVRSLYLSALAQKELLRAQRRYTSALDELVRQIARDVEAGKKAPIDLLKAESEAEGARTQAQRLAASIEITKASLMALIGKDPGKLEPIKIRVRSPRKEAQSGLEARILKLRKLKIEEMAVKKAEKQVAKSEAAKLPQLSLSAYVGRNYGEDVAHDLGWQSEDIVQIGLHGSFNLLDFGRRSIEVQKAQIGTMQAQLKKEQTLRDLRKLLRQGLARIEEAYATYRGNLAQLRLSEKSEAIEKVRYENGVATINDLLLAKGRTQLSRAREIESRYNYKKSLYYLDYLLEKGVK